MIDSNIIESIVREVIRQLEPANGTPKPKLLVISKEENDLEAEIHHLSTYWNVEQATPKACYSYMDVRQALFFNIDQDTLVRIALGFTDTLESKLFIQLITQEIPISIVLEPSLQKLIQSNEMGHRYVNYINKICSYKKTVEEFGVSFTQLEELNRLQQRTCNKEVKASKLITQEKMERFSGDKLVIKPGMILTPLAKDKANERGIDISYSE